MSNSNIKGPLCIDLDGTLLRTDTLYESFFLLIKKNPFYIFLCFIWLLNGKASLKHEISSRVEIKPENLPYNIEILDLIIREKETGRKVWLCTAANEKIARSVSEYLNIFDKVIASDATSNLSASDKAHKILALTDGAGFDYAGNSKDDIKVWVHADNAILVDFSPRHLSKIGTPVLAMFTTKTNMLQSWLRELRIHQWAKNGLIFVPFFVAHEMNNIGLLYNCILAFISFGLCASSVYLLNDIVDLESDRAHKKKKFRPIASGQIPLMHGCIAAILLLATSVSICMFLPAQFFLVLVLYYSITISYSFYIKSKAILDVTVLAILYSIRIIAGAAATGILLSSWLISFSMFLFFSLALVKRVVELKDSNELNKKIKGRGYYPSDLPILLASGISSGYISILVFVLYIDSFASAQFYKNPDFLYLISPLLFVWLTRIWILTWRDEMHEDPVAFAIKDRSSQLIGLAIIFIAVLSTRF